MTHFIRYLALFLILIGGPVNASPLNDGGILATIKPIELIIKAISGDLLTVNTLLGPQQSPHNYQLRPSDREKLDRATHIFWIGPSLETFLSRTLTSISPQKIETLGDQHTTTHHHHENALDQDPHLWMDYSQIQAIAFKIEKKLAMLYPQHSAIFAKNLREFLAKLKVVNDNFNHQLLPNKHLGIIQSHASFNRLFANYGIKNHIALSDEHGQAASVRQWHNIDTFIEHQSPQCLLTDPAEKSSQQEALLEKHPLKVIVSDPMAHDIKSSTDGFVEFYTRISTDIVACLSTL